ncbi:type III secretion system cytoplasmic ring protein SctQ [Acanthopleuribacter pedis]|uniref:Type III secretion system cytoplasmic ring protein SctQ n=1 Tax=Acanthopleuribacter pedis TaxID=442870 RepID=A0A8J7QQ60_9BACT|nr:type III secretion system cytoplasmic ring protein SctQ [Acanthopleuribacter pedis]MBO1322598.1 type III secretion system cytoplasmic ring protein SctQ [Acanthopleuribacter pedis]
MSLETPTVSAFEPRTIQGHEAYLLNRIFRKNGCFSVDLGDQSYQVKFSPVPFLYQPTLALEIGAGESQVRVALEHMDFMANVSETLGNLPLAEMPEELRNAVFETVLEGAMKRFEVWSGLHSHVRQVLYPIDQQGFDAFFRGYGQTMFFQLIRLEDQKPIRGQISFKGNAMALFADLLEKIQAFAFTTWENMAFGARVEVGFTAIQLGEVRGLGLHDIVLFDQCGLDPTQPGFNGMAMLRIPGDMVLVGKLNQSIFTVEKIQMQEQQEGGEQAMADGLDSLDINMVFEIGRKEINLGDLRAIQPGFVIDLEQPLEKPVTIRANGKLIGRGELVQVEESLGVRFLELFDQ